MSYFSCESVCANFTGYETTAHTVQKGLKQNYEDFEAIPQNSISKCLQGWPR